MGSFLAAGIGVGLGVGAWRQLPPMSPSSMRIVLVVLGLAILGAWFGGRRFSQSQYQQQLQLQLQEQLQEQKQAQEQRVIVNVGAQGPRRAGEGAPPPSLSLAFQQDKTPEGLASGASAQRALAVDGQQFEASHRAIQTILEQVKGAACDVAVDPEGEVIGAQDTAVPGTLSPTPVGELDGEPAVIEKLDMVDSVVADHWRTRVRL